MAQVSFIIIHSTGPRSVPTALGPAPLVTYPHRPSQAGGYSRDCALLPPSPLSGGEPVRAAAAYLGVRTDEARERRRKDEGVTETKRGERRKKISVRFPDTLPLGPQPAERFTRGAMRWYWTSLVDGPMLNPPPGGRRWLLRSRAAGSESPFPAPPQTWRMAAGFGLQANGATPSAPSRTAATLLDPGARQASLPSHLFFFCSRHHRFGQPLAVSATSLLPDLLSTAIPLSSEGSPDSVSLLPPGFRHQCNADSRYGKKEAGTGEHLTHLIK